LPKFPRYFLNNRGAVRSAALPLYSNKATRRRAWSWWSLYPGGVELVELVECSGRVSSYYKETTQTRLTANTKKIEKLPKRY
jgi:hypothetical protein